MQLQVIDTQTKLYLVLELGDGGDLYDYIMKHEGGLEEDRARKYFRQVILTDCFFSRIFNVVFSTRLSLLSSTVTSSTLSIGI